MEEEEKSGEQMGYDKVDIMIEGMREQEQEKRRQQQQGEDRQEIWEKKCNTSDKRKLDKNS